MHQQDTASGDAEIAFNGQDIDMDQTSNNSVLPLSGNSQASSESALGQSNVDMSKGSVGDHYKETITAIQLE